MQPEPTSCCAVVCFSQSANGSRCYLAGSLSKPYSVDFQVLCNRYPISSLPQQQVEPPSLHLLKLNVIAMKTWTIKVQAVIALATLYSSWSLIEKFKTAYMLSVRWVTHALSMKFWPWRPQCKPEQNCPPAPEQCYPFDPQNNNPQQAAFTTCVTRFVRFLQHLPPT